MEATERELRERYEALETEELIDLHRRGELTELASSVLGEVLKERGVSTKQFRKLVAEEDAKEADTTITCEPVSTSLPRLWVGYVIVAVLFIYGVAEIAVDPSMENRISPVLIIGALVGLAYWLFCVYRIHWILGEATNSEYPISPAKGAGFHLIPLFNLYWVFKWPYELARFLNQQSQKDIMVKGWGAFFLVGFVLYKVDGLIGLLALFSALIYVVRRVQQVIRFVPRASETAPKARTPS